MDDFQDDHENLKAETRNVAQPSSDVGIYLSYTEEKRYFPLGLDNDFPEHD